MSWWRHLLGRDADLTQAQRERLQAWQRMPGPGPGAGIMQSRLVVVDVESTGLDVTRDRLIAIGAVAVQAGQIRLEDSFSRILRQEQPSSHANILVHGIGGTAQTGGGEPADVLIEFLDYAGRCPLVAFHAPFDQIMVQKAMRKFLNTGLNATWLDLAHLAPALLPARALQCKALDDWLAAHGIINYSRHDALADALATAQLLLVLLQHARQAGQVTLGALLELAGSQAWLQRHGR